MSGRVAGDWLISRSLRSKMYLAPCSPFFAKRWRVVRRHVAQIEKNCRPRDLACRPRQRQALLHWAYDSRLI